MSGYTQSNGFGLDWVKTFGGTGNDYPADMAMDNEKNIYITGSFEGTVDFDPSISTHYLSSNSQEDAFILKLDSLGEFIWVRSLGEYEDDKGNSIAIDNNGDIIVAGLYRNNQNFTPTNSSFEFGIFNDRNFVLKVDSDGNFIWGHTFNAGLAPTLSIDLQNNIIIAGSFYGVSIDLAPDTLVDLHTSQGASDVYIEKLDSDGQLLWVQTFGGPSFDTPSGIAIDNSGTIYCIGTFYDSLDYDPDTTEAYIYSQGQVDIFILSLDALGNVDWVKSIGGPANEESKTITTDSVGALYFIGRSFDGVDLDPGPGIYNLNTQAICSYFIEKLSSNGSFLWATSTDSSSTGRSNPRAMHITASGEVLVSITISDTADVDPSAGIQTVVANGIYDNCIIYLDTNGQYVRHATLESTNIFDNVLAVILDTCANGYILGEYSSNSGIDLDPGPNTLLAPTYGGKNFFIQKLGACTNSFALDSIIACDSYTWMNGVNYSSSNNVAMHTIANSKNCDSVITLDLTINHSTFSFDTVFACGPFTWLDGESYNASNDTAVYVLTNSKGCDSVINLHLTILSELHIDTVIACESYTWIDSVTYYNSNDTATVTLNNSLGCDSVVMLNLTVNTDKYVIDSIIACDSLTWIDGNTYYSDTIGPSHTLSATNGCDSIVTLSLQTSSSTIVLDTISACDSLTWINGVNYGSSQLIHDTLLNQNGCDSVVTLNLDIKYSTFRSDTILACGEYTWLDGITYLNPTDSVTFTTINTAGCDSISRLTLSLMNSFATDTIVACDSYTWINNVTYTSSVDSVTDTLTNIFGCDSVLNLHLTIKSSSPVSSIDSLSGCDSLQWIDGITYYADNSVANYSYLNSVGCDSVVNLNLSLEYSTFYLDSIVACDSYTWLNGITYYQSSSASITIQNAKGCDSSMYLNLTINETAFEIDSIVACDNYTWIDGNTYNQSTGSAFESFTTQNGCDSLVNLNLTILHSSNGIDSIESCGPFTWIDGNTYTQSNSSAIHILTNTVGCDSVVSIHLIVNESNDSVQTLTACDSLLWMDGITYFSSTDSAFDTLLNVQGCDSVIRLNLELSYSSFTNDNLFSCESYTWIDGVTYHSSNSTAQLALTNQLGCDSIINLNLTIDTINTQISLVGTTLMSNELNAQHQWLKCDSNGYSILTNDTNANFLATENGFYALEISKAGCLDTSDCILIETVGIPNQSVSEGTYLFPNPTDRKLTVHFQGKGAAQISIYNSMGQIVEQRIVESAGDYLVEIKTSAGLYLLEVISPVERKYFTVIKTN